MHLSTQPTRQQARQRSTPRVTIHCKGHMIYVSPPCAALAMFCTERLVSNLQRPRIPEPMFGLDRQYVLVDGYDEPTTQTIGVAMPAGLLQPVRQILKSQRCCVSLYNAPVALPPPASAAQRRTQTTDPAVLEFVRTHSRGIVRVGTNIDVARLCAQIAKAWPQLKIAVVGSLRKTVASAANLLTQELGAHQVSYVTSACHPERLARVTVSTFVAQGNANLDERDLLLVLDPIEILADDSSDCLRSVPGRLLTSTESVAGQAPWLPYAATSAFPMTHKMLGGRFANTRLIGFQPCQQKMSRYDQDWLRAWFGFAEMTAPQHGTISRSVVVTRSKVRGGPRIDARNGVVALKRSGVWRNQLRNRRIAGLVRLLQQGDHKELKQRFPEVAIAMNGLRTRSVVVLVENVEHASVLHALLSAASVVTATSTTQASSSEAAAFDVKIVTESAFPRIDLRSVDVVVCGTGGQGGMPSNSGLGEYNSVIDNRLSPLHVVDFVDETHPVLRKWAKHRMAAYIRAGFVIQGPEWSAVSRFLSDRPAIGGAR